MVHSLLLQILQEFVAVKWTGGRFCGLVLLSESSRQQSILGNGFRTDVPVILWNRNFTIFTQSYNQLSVYFLNNNYHLHLFPNDHRPIWTKCQNCTVCLSDTIPASKAIFKANPRVIQFTIVIIKNNISINCIQSFNNILKKKKKIPIKKKKFFQYDLF